LANVDQGDGSQVVWSTSSELCPKLGNQHLKIVDGVWRKPREPAQGFSLQRGGKHSAQDRAVRGVQAHVHGVHIHVLVGVGRPIVTVHVQAFPHSRQLCPHHIVSE